jgi:hypothetical protein
MREEAALDDRERFLSLRREEIDANGIRRVTNIGGVPSSLKTGMDFCGVPSDVIHNVRRFGRVFAELREFRKSARPEGKGSIPAIR